MIKTGVILGGGQGTRLGMPYNKHATYVYERAMIEYPLQTLKEMGLEKAVVVANPNNLGDLAKIIGDGREYGLEVEYRIQQEPDGMAGALGASAVKDEVFVVLCGDCYFDPAPELSGKPQIWYKEVEFAQAHGVWNPETNRIIEKPLRDIGKRAVIGAYVYDQRVFEFIKGLQPSARGELEITDINNWYLKRGMEISEYDGFFGDMGTPHGLLRVANHIEGKE